MKRLLLFLATLALTAAVTAKADTIIYNNGGPNQANGNEMTQWIQTEEFTLAQATTINDIHFWDVGFDGSYNGSTTWIIYADNIGNPGVMIDSGEGNYNRTFTGTTLLFGKEFINDITGISVSLLGGVQYHLGLHNGPVSHTNRDNRYWETTSTIDGATGRELNLVVASSWFDNRQEHAFNLTTNAAPESSSLILLGTGLLGLASGAFRKLRS